MDFCKTSEMNQPLCGTTWPRTVCEERQKRDHALTLLLWDRTDGLIGDRRLCLCFRRFLSRCCQCWSLCSSQTARCSPRRQTSPFCSASVDTETPVIIIIIIIYRVPVSREPGSAECALTSILWRVLTFSIFEYQDVSGHLSSLHQLTCLSAGLLG